MEENNLIDIIESKDGKDCCEVTNTKKDSLYTSILTENIHISVLSYINLYKTIINSQSYKQEHNKCSLLSDLKYMNELKDLEELNDIILKIEMFKSLLEHKTIELEEVPKSIYIIDSKFNPTKNSHHKNKQENTDKENDHCITLQDYLLKLKTKYSIYEIEMHRKAVIKYFNQHFILHVKHNCEDRAYASKINNLEANTNHTKAFDNTQDLLFLELVKYNKVEEYKYMIMNNQEDINNINSTIDNIKLDNKKKPVISNSVDKLENNRIETRNKVLNKYNATNTNTNTNNKNNTIDDCCDDNSQTLTQEDYSIYKYYNNNNSEINPKSYEYINNILKIEDNKDNVFNNLIKTHRINRLNKSVLKQDINIDKLDIENKLLGDWGLGIGDWGLGPIPNPQSPIPNPQSPI